MTVPAKLIDDVVASSLRPRLEALGFRRKGRYFCLSRAGAFACAGVQASQYNAGDSGRFTVNLGVYFPALAQLFGETKRVTFPLPHQCAMSLQERLPPLALGSDQWWEVTAGDVEGQRRAAAEVGQFWDVHAMAWFDERLDLRRAQALCLSGRGDPLVASALSVLLGELDEAREHLARALAGRRNDRGLDADHLRRTFPALAADQAQLDQSLELAREGLSRYEEYVQAFARRAGIGEIE